MLGPVWLGAVMEWLGFVTSCNLLEEQGEEEQCNGKASKGKASSGRGSAQI